MALVHAALIFGIDGADNDGSYTPLYARIAELKRAEQDASGGSNLHSLIPLELAKEAAQFLNFKVRTFIAKAKLVQVNQWLIDNPAGSKMDHNRSLGEFVILSTTASFVCFVIVISFLYL